MYDRFGFQLRLLAGNREHLYIERTAHYCRLQPPLGAQFVLLAATLFEDDEDAKVENFSSILRLLQTGHITSEVCEVFSISFSKSWQQSRHLNSYKGINFSRDVLF